jgi:hypothetical protein
MTWAQSSLSPDAPCTAADTRGEGRERENPIAGKFRSEIEKFAMPSHSLLLAIAVVAYSLPAKKTRLAEVASVAVTGAATFAILDAYAPAAAGSARTGAGFGVGGNLVGFA